jgi:NAD(P)-dependent dehydrogenase (short-subunit alcohol dehydrogenase family)
MRNDRVAIVTGASSGIGEASARCLARAGFRVALAARRGQELERLAKQIGEQGGIAVPVPTDLADEAQTQRLVARTLESFGRVDVLLNNAGFSPAAPIELLPRAELRRTFEVNLLAGLALIGAVTPVMREQGGGRILNMSSLASRVPAPIAVTYSATKAGIEAATDALRLELAPFGIECVLIVPGFVDTPTFDNSREMGRALREDPSSPYHALMHQLDAFARVNQASAISPESVGRVVVLAATARRPRTRYFVPGAARYQARFLRALPDRVLDRILARVYGISIARPR